MFKLMGIALIQLWTCAPVSYNKLIMVHKNSARQAPEENKVQK